MNNKTSKNYSSIFIVSVVLSTILILFFLLAILNIKFLIYPSMITDILLLFPNINYVHEHFFCNPSNRFTLISLLLILDNIYFMVSIVISTILLYYLNIKNNKFLIYKLVTLFVFVVLFFIYDFLFQKNFVNLLTAKIFLIFLIYYIFNFILSNKNIFIKFLLLIPLINLLLVPIHTIQHIYCDYFNKGKYNNIVLILSLVFMFFGIQVAVVLSVSQIMNKLISFYSPSGVYHINNVNNTINYISYQNISLMNNRSVDFMPQSIDDFDAYNLFIEETNLQKQKKFKIDFKTEIQDLQINYIRKEIYTYDGTNNKFLILDYDTGNIIREKKLVDDFYVKYSMYNNITTERISFDNNTQTIALALEHSYLYIFDMNTLEIIRQEQIPTENDSIIFNKTDNSYVLSFWTMTPYIISCPIDTQKEVRKIRAPVCQGEMAYSNKNKEIYLSLHQQGQIYVYDANTYTLKRKIKVRYGVKNVNYDEQYNILLTTSYFSGYLDIISMKTDKVVYSKFVHYHARQPVICNNIIYVPTTIGIYRYDVKHLLEKLEYEK